MSVQEMEIKLLQKKKRKQEKETKKEKVLKKGERVSVRLRLAESRSEGAVLQPAPLSG